MSTVLVTDGEQRAALAVVRSLGRAGHRVLVVSARGRSLAGASRHAEREVAVPDALGEPGAFADAVERLVRSEGVDVLLPIAEPALLALLPTRARLAPARLPFADPDAFRRVSDKAFLTEVAPDLGIAVPMQRVARDPAEAAALPADELCYPLVLKPGRSVGEADGTRRKLGVSYATGPAELRARLAAMPEAAYPLLLQQRIVGPGVGVFLLLWEGEVVAQFAHRRLREKPPAGGVSVYRESVAADPALVARSRALLDRCGMRGVAMVEYKLDAASGTPYLMEINGRFWGSLQLAVDAGVDFPRLLVELALGRRPAPVTRYRPGVRSRWWWGDVDHLLARLRHGPERLALPPGAPGRWAVVRDFLRVWRPGDRNEILRLSDPRPFLRETYEWFQGR
jgi:predicted ATP-grasp superfamily ATP-dependent carboligase